jgi:hypothetical protein
MYCSTFGQARSPNGHTGKLDPKKYGPEHECAAGGDRMAYPPTGEEPELWQPRVHLPGDVVIVVPVEGSKASSYESGGRPLNRHDAAGFRQHDDDVVAGR